MSEEITFKKNLALIGIGRWGKNHARNFHKLGALHTICDTRETTHDVYLQMYPDVNWTTNYNSVLENPEITAVAIAAPAARHYELTKQALNAGKDVFVEKPLCLDSAEGEELVTLADKKGCLLMVGHLLQYHPCVKKMQEIVRTGELGRLHYITSNRLNLGYFRMEENALWNFAPHDISVILSLCNNQLPKSVRCTGGDYITKGVQDTSLMTLEFDHSIKAHIYVSWLNPFKEQKLVVIGSSGMLVFDDTQPWSDKLLFYRNYVTWTHGHIPEVNSCIPEKVFVVEKEPLREECRHFLECCSERRTPSTDGDEGLRVLKVLQAAEVSMTSSGKETIPCAVHNASLGVATDYFAHPTAVIDSDVEIGSETKIWHFTHIMQGARLGAKCNIGQNVVISPGVVLGANVKIQNNVSVYTGVECEDDVFLGPSMVFTNIINPRSAVSRKDEYRKTLVRKGATIGANATILCGLELGEYCFVGAGSVVTKNVKPFALVAGNPARPIGWMSKHGEKLDLPATMDSSGIMTAKCPVTGELYCLSGEGLSLLQIDTQEILENQGNFLSVSNTNI